MLIIVSTSNEMSVSAVWGEQISELKVGENKNAIWLKGKGPMSCDMFIFATKTIEREILDMTIPLYVKLVERNAGDDFMMISGKKVKAHVVCPLYPKGKSFGVIDWYSVHDAWVKQCDKARRSGGEVLRQLCFELNLPMNGSEIETVAMMMANGYKNEINGIRPPFHSMIVKDGNLMLEDGPLIYGPDLQLIGMDKGKMGDEKLFRLLEATWKADEYLIYAGAAPGYSIQKFLRNVKTPRYASLYDPRKIQIDKRTFKTGNETIKINTGKNGLLNEMTLKEEIMNWNNKRNGTESIYLFSDIRFEHEDYPDKDEWIRIVEENNALQRRYIQILKESGVPFKYMLKHRIPDVNEESRLVLSSANCWLFRAAYSRPDLYELREYCIYPGTEQIEIEIDREVALAINSDGDRYNFSREQHKGLMSLHINNKLTNESYDASVDLFYLTNKRNEWTYEKFKAKASSSAFATWWVSNYQSMDYDDEPIPHEWFTRLASEDYSVSVFDGDLITLAIQEMKGQFTKIVDYEWLSHFVVTINCDILERTHAKFARELRYSQNSYYSQSRGLRDGANAYKRFDPLYAMEFSRLKEWCKTKHGVDISGHLRMMMQDGLVKNYDIPRWIRQTYASNVINGSPALADWGLMDALSAKSAQKDVIPYEKKGEGHVWHTRTDLVWTLAVMKFIFHDKGKNKIFFPEGIVFEQLKTCEYEIDQIVGLLPLSPTISGSR